MKTRAFIALLVPIACAILLGCSTTPPGPEPPDPPLAYFPPPPDPLPPVQACYASTRHCVDLDSRPFALCVVGAERCERDVGIIPLDSAHETARH
jgi:hypothetical protein